MSGWLVAAFAADGLRDAGPRSAEGLIDDERLMGTSPPSDPVSFYEPFDRTRKHGTVPSSMESRDILRRVSAAILVGSVSLLIHSRASAGPPRATIESRVDGRLYIWRVINADGPPIISFQVPVYAVYNPTVPNGWRREKTAGTLRTWAESPAQAVHAGQSGEFSVRATSSGAVLTEGSAVVGYDGGSLAVPGVWVPQPEGIWTVLTPPLVILAIVLIDLAIAKRRRRRAVRQEGESGR